MVPMILSPAFQSWGPIQPYCHAVSPRNIQRLCDASTEPEAGKLAGTIQTVILIIDVMKASHQTDRWCLIYVPPSMFLSEGEEHLLSERLLELSLAGPAYSWGTNTVFAVIA